MYYIAKAAQAVGLFVIGIDFIRTFPGVMNRQILGMGIVLFAFGWIIERFLLKQ